MTTAIVFIIYIAVIGIIGIISFKKIQKTSDFYIAGKSGSTFAISGSLLATILGGSAIIGSIDAAPNLGWAISWYMLCASAGLLALLPLVKQVSLNGKYTLPDLIEKFYGKTPKQISSIIIPIAWLGIISAQIIASGRILNSFFDLDYSYGVLLSGIFFIAYTIIGGQISVIKTDVFQAIIIIIGLVLLSYFALLENNFTIPIQNGKEFPFNPKFHPTDLFILVITYATTFTTGPDIYSRIFSSKNEKIAFRSILIVAIILIPIAFILGLIGAYSNLIIDSSTQTNSALIVDLTFKLLPKWAQGIMFAALISAVLSTAATILLNVGIIVTNLFSKDIDKKNSIQTTRINTLIIGIISIIISLYSTSVINTLFIALSFYSGAFTIPLIFGLLKIRTSSYIANCAMIFGGSIALLGKLIMITNVSVYGNAIIIFAFIINLIIMLLGAVNFRLKK